MRLDVRQRVGDALDVLLAQQLVHARDQRLAVSAMFCSAEGSVWITGDLAAVDVGQRGAPGLPPVSWMIGGAGEAR